MNAKVVINFVLAVSCLVSLGCVASQGDVTSVYARQTRLEDQMDRLTKEVRALKANSSPGTNAELTEKVYQLEAAVKELNQSYSQLQARVSQMGLGTAPSTTGSEFTDVASIGTTTANNEELIFNLGYKELGEGDFQESRVQFREFLSKYPKSSKASDATYWIAESYYREGEYEEAILEYQSFIDTYPKDERVRLAYLKQGLSLVEIGKEEEAQLFFQTLIDKYPNSDEAKTAKEKITELAVER